MSHTLEGRVAVVTGGASGIGEACARDLAARGARLVIADINEALAKQVAASLKGAIHARLDVTSVDDTEALAERVAREMGPTDILVASAGVLQPPLPPEELSMEIWDRVIAVDQRGVYVSNVAFGRRMALRGAGSIINIASVTSFRSAPLHAYAPAKAAVVSITQTLATEWGRSGVRVNAIAPGYVLTPALQAAIDDGKRDPKALEENSAFGRLIRTEEIAKACSFLASDDASGITGVALPVDGGWLVAPPWHTYGGVPPKRG
ncbi:MULTISPECIES: SDR family NAD(P)-dependent oxidoreductase [Oceanibaculum]|uniref:3-oxoacyl-ACP reductase n=1 Tax=Oceanibaculum indicum P24 TaxID=1207063 RepID=K2J0Y6_9PROT|nr:MULTISPECIES: SDR family oxidoreductase [Oceanibaculum]EKE76581.1 3-oxoacyl-ACP reductase [Oceanibaculum indicum P24]MCH2395737.1 SDR family oxidoreductase [Oceanibaculum sp.]